MALMSSVWLLLCQTIQTNRFVLMNTTCFKIPVFWDATLCRLLSVFWKSVLPQASVLLELQDHEYGGSMLLQNTDMALHTRRRVFITPLWEPQTSCRSLLWLYKRKRSASPSQQLEPIPKHSQWTNDNPLTSIGITRNERLRLIWMVMTRILSHKITASKLTPSTWTLGNNSVAANMELLSHEAEFGKFISWNSRHN